MMNRAHWTEQEMVERLYGIRDSDQHMDACGECRDRWTAILARRRDVTQAPEVPHEILAAQRRNIYRKLGREPRPRMAHMAPAFAAVLLLLLGFFFMRPTPQPAVVGPAPVSDDRLFSEICALEQTSEPHFAKPMRALFEEN